MSNFIFTTMDDGDLPANVSTSPASSTPSRNTSGWPPRHDPSQLGPDGSSKEMTSSDVIVISSSIIVTVAVLFGCLGIIRGIIFWMKKREELADLQDLASGLSSSGSSQTRTMQVIRRQRRLRNMGVRSEGRGVSSHRHMSRNDKGLTPQRITELGGVFEYRDEDDKSRDLEEGLSECAVCLDSYQAGETLRRLGVCGHEFHQECLDSWLEIHGTCPLCRNSACAGPHKEETAAQEQEATAESLAASVHHSSPDPPVAPLQGVPSEAMPECPVPETQGMEGLELPVVRWRVVRVGSGVRQEQVPPEQGAGHASVGPAPPLGQVEGSGSSADAAASMDNRGDESLGQVQGQESAENDRGGSQESMDLEPEEGSHVLVVRPAQAGSGD